MSFTVRIIIDCSFHPIFFRENVYNYLDIFKRYCIMNKE